MDNVVINHMGRGDSSIMIIRTPSWFRSTFEIILIGIKNQRP